MRFLLRLKHWQLFLITWGLPIAIDIYAFTDIVLLFRFFPLIMIVFTVGVFGWIWAIATVLHPKLPADVKLNLLQFKLLFAVPILYVLAIVGFMEFETHAPEGSSSEMNGWVGGLIIVIHLLSMVCIFLGLRFAAKVMKSVELGRMARFSDYVGEFFLMWFSIVGYWVLQPRLNKLTDDTGIATDATH